MKEKPSYEITQHDIPMSLSGYGKRGQRFYLTNVPIITHVVSKHNRMPLLPIDHQKAHIKYYILETPISRDRSTVCVSLRLVSISTPENPHTPMLPNHSTLCPPLNTHINAIPPPSWCEHTINLQGINSAAPVSSLQYLRFLFTSSYRLDSLEHCDFLPFIGSI